MDGHRKIDPAGSPRRGRKVTGLEAAMLLAAFAVCATFLFGGFGEAGSYHLASAFN